MGCVNHPNAPVAATCKRCKDELCGMCTQFLDSGEYCEKCAAMVEAESYRAKRDQNQELRDMEVAHSTTVRIDEEEERQKSRNKDLIYLRGGIFVGCFMVFAALGLYAYPDLMKSDTQIAQEQSIIELEACREIFQGIGIMLSEGEIPETTMTCPGTNLPNLISRRGSTTIVTHPNPRQFGLAELYVTSDSHRVVMQ